MDKKYKYFKKNKKLKSSKYNYKSSKTGSSSARRKTAQKKELFNNQVCHLLKWLIRTYGISTSIYDHSTRYRCFLSHLYLEKGLKFSLNAIKEDRLHVLQYLSGTRPLGTRFTNDGLPRRLGDLIPYIRRKDSPKELRWILTLLYSLRRFHLPLSPNLETVTSPSTAKYYEWIFKYLPGFTKAVVKRLPCIYKSRCKRKLNFPSWQGYHLTTKGGPSKGQALVNSLQDLISLPDSLINSIKTFSGETLHSNMTLLYCHRQKLSEIMDQPLSGPKSFRKLTAIPDSEGKTRLIAIGDYWSQTCLKPLHDYLNRVLRSIPQDQTFNQGKGLGDLPFSSDRTYYSFDLSAFTDRFPIKILLGLLFYNYGSDKAKAWYDIIAGYAFEYKSPKGLLNNVRYNVGNPMGFYTSWPLTTLCHHFIVYVACQECGISWRNADYKLLGDDIIIYNKALALKYQELISLIGVEIQLQKSHIGTDLFEFAKRIFTPCGEISPFSIKAGLSETRSYISFFQMISTYYERAWIPVTSMLGAVLDFSKTRPFRVRSRDRPKDIFKLKCSYLLFKRLNGYDESLTIINYLQGYLDYPYLSCNMVNKAKAMLISCIVSSFEESASSFSGDLSYRLERALLHYTGVDEGKHIDVVYAHPYAFVYGKYIEEAYLSQMKQAYDFDTLYSGEWLPYFRILKASDANLLFSTRNYISRKSLSSSPLLLKKLKEAVHTLGQSPYLS